MTKKKKVCSNECKKGYVDVPTYLFPQGMEYAKEVIPLMKFKESKDKRTHKK